ncbi:metal ABC transporter permease [Anabaena sp. FACHB-709]|uniref:ABC transporter permease protein n=2 Tax=Nostocaceae TaxID=1162 RepID=A0A1Z4KSB0_ANAVA|nr:MULTISPECIES: metal ABC transporter permease [Nostocaceae]BAY71801.1 ABC transporter permease protein [Trichormus variabilis NIES-23]HBW33710.1 metal ABC transporter permease [Nostoc sp. UBA8866]MBD2172292.1 metal ABC transporter permease [Anabaena cylindrica FACHB-318]MBD2263887.1 metal ABC transporter permease [Anabaena sp. FACHB-709]MBD2273232.1 metal ABC transporter permease [Nostoc sp. PCC 7120 = FACHB-418]
MLTTTFYLLPPNSCCLIGVASVQDLASLLQFPFMQRAIAGAVLMGVLGGLLGSFVTLRQLSFFSHAVGHAALVGVVLGVLLQVNPTSMLLPFTLAFGVVVLYLIDQTDLGSDSVLSIVLSGALAIGVILTNLIQGYRGNLIGVLFGDILAIDTTDLILTFLVLVTSSIFLLSTLRQQILLTLNLDVAKVQGVPVQLYRYGFVVLLSLAVAVAIKAVGVLLVNAFLVIPAATAKLMSHHFQHYLVMSMLVGAASSIIGMVLSGAFNLASGPSIVLIQVFLFVAVFIWVKLYFKAA